MTRVAVVGLGFGDEGKGACVDSLARMTGIDTVVRFSGGPQAAHNVVAPDGIHHCFASFGSHLLANPGGRTLYDENVLFSPQHAMEEGVVLKLKGCEAGVNRLTLQPRCPVITPFHVLAGRIRHEAARNRVGTCGLGVGETVRDIRTEGVVLRVGDLESMAVTRDKLSWIRAAKKREIACMDLSGIGKQGKKALAMLQDRDGNIGPQAETVRLCLRTFRVDDRKPENFILEGSQGVLLDPSTGFFPHVTKTDITAKAARRTGGDAFVIGAVRAYATRHGAGPLPTEGFRATEPHNLDNPWQGPFRTGYPDMVLLATAIRTTGGVDGLAVSCLDMMSYPSKVCVGYRFSGDGEGMVIEKDGDLAVLVDGAGKSPEAVARFFSGVSPVYAPVQGEADLLALMEKTAKTPVVMTGRGPAAGDREWFGTGF